MSGSIPDTDLSTCACLMEDCVGRTDHEAVLHVKVDVTWPSQAGGCAACDAALQQQCMPEGLGVGLGLAGDARHVGVDVHGAVDLQVVPVLLQLHRVQALLQRLAHAVVAVYDVLQCKCKQIGWAWYCLQSRGVPLQRCIACKYYTQIALKAIIDLSATLCKLAHVIVGASRMVHAGLSATFAVMGLSGKCVP